MSSFTLVPNYVVAAESVTAANLTSSAVSSHVSSSSAGNSTSTHTANGAAAISLSWKSGLAIGALVASPIILSLGL
ncbi:hypothetical protein WICPIJ_005150 [Wickerhamomyces pijperi]|uniref:Uncharacterized protein n=1 Tax=Wickerhamomyces pijperi TaxID=599730 RepID=A0A9P8Q6P4_WICPI|nr:hypothetical protein WICPIJ_005150 [Wickerhamomyces pijperi]